MDHSIQAYIEGLSTEQLEAIMKQYYEEEFEEDFSYAVPYMEYVLARRKAETEK